MFPFSFRAGCGQWHLPNRVHILTISDADRVKLERRAQDRSAPARVAGRARIVLLSADGLTGPQIADRVGCTEPTVVKWRRQYAPAGLAGLEDAPRPGGPKTVLTEDAIAEIMSATITPPPGSLQAMGVTHWSSRRLADWLRRSRKLQVSHDSIARLWRRFCLPLHSNASSRSSRGRPSAAAHSPRSGPDRRHRRLHRPLEPAPGPVHLDQRPRRDLSQHQTCED